MCALECVSQTAEAKDRWHRWKERSEEESSEEER